MKASRPAGAAALTIGLAAGFAASTVATAAIGGATVGALTAAGTTALSTHLQDGQMDDEAVLQSMLEGWLWGAAGSLGGTAASSIVGNALYNPVKSVGTSVGNGAGGAGKGINSFEAAKKIVNAERVGSGLKGDTYHRAASYLSESQISRGTVYDLGKNNTLLQVEGGVNSKTGIFEYILNENGQVTHQLFKEGGVINGIPN